VVNDAISSLVGFVIDLVFCVILATLTYLSIQFQTVPMLTVAFLFFGVWFRYFTSYSIKLKERNNDRERSSSDFAN
jgi:hypothetical protein